MPTGRATCPPSSLVSSAASRSSSARRPHTWTRTTTCTRTRVSCPPCRRGRSASGFRSASAPGARGARYSPGGVSGPAGARGCCLRPGGRRVIAVISVYKVANFPDGGGHFWVYMQYAQGLRRLGCDVYWLEQFRPPDDPAAETRMLSAFFERLRRFGLEGKALLYARDRGPAAGPDALRFVGGEWSDAERGLRQAGLVLQLHYASDPPPLACAPRPGPCVPRPGP